MYLSKVKVLQGCPTIKHGMFIAISPHHTKLPKKKMARALYLLDLVTWEPVHEICPRHDSRYTASLLGLRHALMSHPDFIDQLYQVVGMK
nr:hypothetical protein [Candidatus Sigynarchaeota archaeon]